MKERILIVDDEKEIRSIHVDRRCGYSYSVILIKGWTFNDDSNDFLNSSHSSRAGEQG